MKSFLYSVFSEFPKKLKTLSKTFNPREWIIFGVLACILIVTSVSVLNALNRSLTVQVPAYGGTLEEGIIGTPRFVNPVLAFSDVDRDLVHLVYSGLMRHTDTGEIISDLAESHTVSEDGLTYTFVIRDDAQFHDGKPVISEDIVFTINRIKDPLTKSPRRPSFEGVEVTAIDERTVEFRLKQPFGAFLSTMTIGILPSHLWMNVTADEFSFTDLNTDPVGSGPYKLISTNKKSGIPVEYKFRSFKDFTLGRPHIRTLVIHFFNSEKDVINALARGTIDSASAISSGNAETLRQNDYRVETTLLPRIFAVFYNQNRNPIFREKAVLEAFDMAINRDELVDTILGGYGTPIDSPLPSKEDTVISFDPETAISLLEKAEWKLNEEGIRQKTISGEVRLLAFTLATSDTPELAQAAQKIEAQLLAIGAQVNVQLYDIGTLNQSVIRPREYESVLFGQVVTQESDLFAFWHSSQRNDPGLNIALYTNPRADQALEKTLVLSDPEERLAQYEKFKTEIQSDRAALFLYAPDFIYVVPEILGGLDLDTIRVPSDRFLNIYKWYIETDSVWKIFNR